MEPWIEDCDRITKTSKEKKAWLKRWEHTRKRLGSTPAREIKHANTRLIVLVILSTIIETLAQSKRQNKHK